MGVKKRNKKVEHFNRLNQKPRNKGKQKRDVEKEYPDLGVNAIKKYEQEYRTQMGQCKSLYTSFRNQLQAWKATGANVNAKLGNMQAGAVEAFERALEPLRQYNYDREKVN